MRYEEAKEALLADLRAIDEEDRDITVVTCFCGNCMNHSVNDLIREIEEDTPRGRELVEALIQLEAEDAAEQPD